MHAVDQAGKDLWLEHGILHNDGRVVEIDGHVQVAADHEVLDGNLGLGRDVNLGLLQVLDDDGDMEPLVIGSEKDLQMEQEKYIGYVKENGPAVTLWLEEYHDHRWL